MNLTESDVRAVANNRYWTKKRVLWLFGVLFGSIVLAVFVMSLTDSAWSLLVYVGSFAYLGAALRNAWKLQKVLIAQWKAEQQ